MTPAMTSAESLKNRELAVRVATLELLVADLLHLVRQVSPEAVDALAAEAARDADLQDAHSMPGEAENQRYRLRQIMQGRARNLASRRFSSRLAMQHCAPTD